MKKRIESIDILRGIAIPFILILTHGYWAWVAVPFPIFDPILIRIAYFGTGIFVTFTGASTFLFINNKMKNSVRKRKILSNIFKRAIFIFTIPTCISIFYWYITSGEIIAIRFILYWNVFQLIAVGMITFFFIPFLKIKIRIFLYFTLFFLIFLIGHLILFFNVEPLLFLTYGSEGDFPFFPYSNYILFGLFLGDFLVNLADGKYYIYLFIFCSISIINIINWIIWLREIEYLYIESMVWSLSTLLIAFSILYYYVDRKNHNFISKNRLLNWGRYSFSIFYVVSILIYIVEFILIIFYLKIVSRELLLFEFFIIFGICCVIIYLFTLLWERIEYKYGMEWFMRKFADFTFVKKKTADNTLLQNNLEVSK